MNPLFAERIKGVPVSFIREILKVTSNPEIISFAGGLPNPDFFPVEEISAAARKVLKEEGKIALQYSTTEGSINLRKLISERYLAKKGLVIPPEEIQITNGSQQAISLLCKTFLNKGEKVILEKPGYLGAIQAVSFYEPEFITVPLEDEGINTDILRDVYENNKVKLFYTVPNFQNPSGTTYSEATRMAVADIIREHETVFVEDDPYGEIRFEGKETFPVKKYCDKSILLGSFSKSVAPGFRIGWICAKPELMEKIVISKQAADLHSSTFNQSVIYHYLKDNDIDAHVAKIRKTYKSQKDAMVESIKKYFPPDTKFTNPEGGMFLWAALPGSISTMELFNISIKQNVAFVPGSSFYVDGSGGNTMRLNYSNSSEEKIEEGMKRLGNAIKTLMAKQDKVFA